MGGMLVEENLFIIWEGQHPSSSRMVFVVLEDSWFSHKNLLCRIFIAIDCYSIFPTFLAEDCVLFRKDKERSRVP